MKHITLSFVLAIIATLACQGQGKYQISGKISGRRRLDEEKQE